MTPMTIVLALASFVGFLLLFLLMLPRSTAQSALLEQVTRDARGAGFLLPNFWASAVSYKAARQPPVAPSCGAKFVVILYGGGTGRGSRNRARWPGAACKSPGTEQRFSPYQL